MSLYQAIKSGKEHRKGYRARGKAGDHDKTCRPHGGGTSIPCTYCERNRAFKLIKLDAKARDELTYDPIQDYT